MKTTTLIIGILCALLLAIFIASAIRYQRRMVAALPPQVRCASQSAALALAVASANESGAGQVIAILGTGSMQPYLPAAGPGEDPQTTVVAFAVTRPHATFADIRVGDLVLYRAAWLTRSDASVCHQAATRDSSGWIVSGLHNAHYEAAWRVTEENFLGIVVQTFTWSQQ